MDRMKTALMLFLLFALFPTGVLADEGVYVPTYVASPTATVAPLSSASPIPVTTEVQPEITCTLKITVPTNTSAPMEVWFNASGRVNQSPVLVFWYEYGDGESATGSGTMKYTYNQPGTYQVRVTPVVVGAPRTPICKGTITVTGSTATSSSALLATPSLTPAIASSASAVSVQPKTGPDGWYWASMTSLLIVWLGALAWYQTQRPQTG